MRLDTTLAGLAFLWVCGWAYADEKAIQPKIELQGLLKKGELGAYLLPKDGSAAIPFANPQRLADTLDGFPSRVEGVMNSDGTLELTEVKSGAALFGWGAERSKLDGLDIEPLARSFQAVAMAFTRASYGYADDALQRYYQALRSTQSELGKLLDVTRTDKQRNSLLDLGVLVEDERKSIYDRCDLYAPHVYLAMYRQSRSGVFLKVRPDRAKGSGVLIGEDLVLTCHHCLFLTAQRLRKHDLADLRVVLDWEQDANGKLIECAEFQVVEVVVESKSLDYAVLRITPIEGAARPGTDRIQSLSKSLVPLDRAIYVVGHPQGKPRIISDNAFVVFPFEINGAELYEIKLRVQLRYRSEMSGDVPDKEVEAILKDIERRYVRQAVDRFRYFWVPDTENPTMGADCDTFGGNSGSPVFLKESHELVGILYAGSPDRNEPYSPGWRRHERIVPAVAIIADMEAQGKSPESLGIKVE